MRIENIMSRAETILHTIDEVSAKRKVRIRNKRVKVVFSCPPFYKKVGVACIQDTPQEARRASVTHKLAWKFSTRKKFRQLLSRRKQSLALRASIFGHTHQATTGPNKPDEFLNTVKLASGMRRLLTARANQQGTAGVSTSGIKGGKGIKVTIPTTTPISQGIK